MGVRGLTTFINNRSHLYLKDHELHDCNVVIDGNSLASNLYKWHSKSNDCFGGDYDKFARVVVNFFEVLSQCNITPYIILDGGYEHRKLNTVISRMRNKIRAAYALNAVTEGSDSVFPLFLREVFVDIVLNLKLKVVRCEFEGDMDIAGIARALNCPVLSYDSDFYIFGCLYIPFSTVDITLRKGKDKTILKSYSYIQCKIYNIETFLQAFGGLDQDSLPLLAVILGNDYVKGSLFAPFFRNLKIQKISANQSDQQKRIKSVMVWLQNETTESAIKTILGRFKNRRREKVLRTIQNAMKGYFELNSDLLKFLEINVEQLESKKKLDLDEINEQVEGFEGGENESEEDGENVSGLEEEEVDDILDDNSSENRNRPSETFITHYRNCQYPACLMDMIILNRYYCIPQVEDNSNPHAHTISMEVLGIIYKILTPNSDKSLKIVHRTGKCGIRFTALQKESILAIVPAIEEIQKMTEHDRKNLLLDLLQIDNKLKDILKEFPIEWHLFLISLHYAINRANFDKPIIYASIICFIILNYIDSKIGFFRVSKTFDKKFAQALDGIKSLQVSDHTFQSLPFNDCLIFMSQMMKLFQMDAKLKSNYRLYDKALVHSFSQLQSVLLHVKYLNSLLNNPYPSLEIHRIFNGTFMYNMTVTLRKRTNPIEHLNLILKECPCLLSTIKDVFHILEEPLNIDLASQPAKKLRKRKRKKKVAENVDMEMEIDSGNEDMDVTIDPNNPFSILSVI